MSAKKSASSEFRKAVLPQSVVEAGGEGEFISSTVRTSIERPDINEPESLITEKQRHNLQVPLASLDKITSGKKEAALRFPTTPSKREVGSRFASNKQNHQVYRCIPDYVNEGIATLATEFSVPTGLLARYFFDYGLEDIQNGAVRLVVFPSVSGLTLFPDEYKRRGRPNQKSHSKTQKEKRSSTTGFHGVPQKLHEDIKNLAERRKIRVGEVARFLLEYGLECHKNGTRRLTPDILLEYYRYAYQIPDTDDPTIQIQSLSHSQKRSR